MDEIIGCMWQSERPWHLLYAGWVSMGVGVLDFSFFSHFCIGHKPLLSCHGSLVSQDGLVFMYCWFSPFRSLCNFSLFIAIYNPLNLEPSVKLISVLFTLFSQIINEDNTFNEIEFCRHFWEIPLRLPLVPGNHL